MISAHSRASGNPAFPQPRKDWVPAFALGHAHAFQFGSRNKDLAKPAPLAQTERVMSQYEGFLATSVSSTLEMCACPSAFAGTSGMDELCGRHGPRPCSIVLRRKRV